jgi:membrane-bound lytic murein transglycosylase F
VEDAQRLAAKHGDDPKKWDDVSYWLLHLSESEYYTDPVVEFGFCRGLEPVTYVSLILDRFAHYRQFVVTRNASAGHFGRRAASTVDQAHRQSSHGVPFEGPSPERQARHAR